RGDGVAPGVPGPPARPKDPASAAPADRELDARGEPRPPHAPQRDRGGSQQVTSERGGVRRDEDSAAPTGTSEAQDVGPFREPEIGLDGPQAADAGEMAAEETRMRRHGPEAMSDQDGALRVPGDLVRDPSRRAQHARRIDEGDPAPSGHAALLN